LICGVLLVFLLNYLLVCFKIFISNFDQLKKVGHPIFPGQNEEEQLSMIMEVIDFPPINILGQGTRTKLFFGLKFFLFFFIKKIFFF
jgi:hypothetical protein